MKRAAIRYAEILEAGAWVTHQEQDEIAKLLRRLVMTEDQAWDELEARIKREKQWDTNDISYRPNGLPSSKPWVGLSNADLQYQTPHDVIVMRYAEALLKEKNT